MKETENEEKIASHSRKPKINRGQSESGLRDVMEEEEEEEEV